MAAVALVTGAAFCQAPGHADSGPQLPCAGAVFPPYPGVDHAPTVRAWNSSDLGGEWRPPACTGWGASGFSSLVVTVARFRHTSGAEGLRRRIGAISQLAGMLYWSTTRQRWQKLMASAYALDGPEGDRRRQDFSPDEIAQGRRLYFQQEDNLFGKAIYRMHIGSVSRDRVIFDIENAGPLRFALLPVFSPGEMQAIYFLERESQDVWRFYGIARAGGKASGLGAGLEASSINRAVAFYRHLTGIPTDQEPPAAR